MADIIDLILRDHQRIRRLTAARGQARCHPQGPPPAWAIADTWDQLAGLLEMHTSAEEEICYLPLSSSCPAVARQMEDACADHADIREAAAEARLQPAGSAPWWRAAGFALAACTSHLNHEENHVLAAFARCADPALRQMLGHQWMAFCTAWAPRPGHAPPAGRPRPSVTGTARGMCAPPPREEGAAMAWLTGHWNETWMVAAKAVLLYMTALAGLRFGTRRTLAQMSPFDFITAVAMGAIIGRTAPPAPRPTRPVPSPSSP
jgi:hypothetical protein